MRHLSPALLVVLMALACQGQFQTTSSETQRTAAPIGAPDPGKVDVVVPPCKTAGSSDCVAAPAPAPGPAPGPAPAPAPIPAPAPDPAPSPAPSPSSDGTPQAALGAGKPGPFTASRNLSITVTGDNVAAYAYELRTGTTPTCAGFTATTFAPIATPLTVTLPASPINARLCVLGRSSAGTTQQTPTEQAWSHLPRRVPHIAAGTKISTAAPAFTAPAPGSNGCGQFLTGFGADHIWRPTAFRTGTTLHVFMPCKYGDAGFQGWHLLHGKLDTATATTGTWTDTDAGTAGVQPLILKTDIAEGATAVSDFKYLFMAANDAGALFGIGANRHPWKRHGVVATSITTLNATSYKLTSGMTALADVDLPVATPMTFAASVGSGHLGGIYHEAGTTYVYHPTQDDAGRWYLSVATTGDFVTYQAATTPIVEGHLHPHILKLGDNAYALLARQTADPSRWSLFYGSSPTSFDATTPFTFRLDRFAPEAAAWDAFRGVSEIFGFELIGDDLYALYFAGTSGYTPANVPYGSPRDVGLLKIPLATDAALAFTPQIRVTDVTSTEAVVASKQLVDFSTLPAGNAVRSYKIYNDGYHDLVLGEVVVPNGFALATPLSKTTVKRGETATLALSCPPATTTAAGTFVLPSNAAYDQSFELTVVCSRQPAAPEIPTASLALWLRADRMGQALSDGASVAVWPDASGLGRHASLVAGAPLLLSGASATVNGKPVVRFGGADGLRTPWSGPGTTGLTIFVVAKGTNYQSLVRFQDNGGGNYVVYPWSGTQVFIVSNDGGTGNGVNSGFVSGSWNLGTARFAAGVAGGISTRINGVAVAARNAANVTLPSGTLFLGTYGGVGEFSIADVAEVVVYGAALSDGDRDTVEAYLLDRYDLN